MYTKVSKLSEKKTLVNFNPNISQLLKISNIFGFISVLNWQKCPFAFESTFMRDKENQIVRENWQNKIKWELECSCLMSSQNHETQYVWSVNYWKSLVQSPNFWLYILQSLTPTSFIL